jgi:hypothetical protein
MGENKLAVYDDQSIVWESPAPTLLAATVQKTVVYRTVPRWSIPVALIVFD